MPIEYGISDISSGEDEVIGEDERRALVKKELEKLRKEVDEMEEDDHEEEEEEEEEEEDEWVNPYDVVLEVVREKRGKQIEKRAFDGKIKPHDIGHSANHKIDEANDTKSYKQGIIDDWDSETDLSFDNGDYDEPVLGIAISKYPDREAIGKYVEHYLALCKSRGYDFNTAKLPSNMTWSHKRWIRPYPEDKYKEIEHVLKKHAIPIINNRTGKDLEVLHVTAVNHWSLHDGLHFFVTFEASDKNNTTDKYKRIYQTRLVFSHLDSLDRFHFRSCRLVNRAGLTGPVHAFREKPNWLTGIGDVGSSSD